MKKDLENCLIISNSYVIIHIILYFLFAFCLAAFYSMLYFGVFVYLCNDLRFVKSIINGIIIIISRESIIPPTHDVP